MVTKELHRAHWCDAIWVKKGIHSSSEQITAFGTPAGIGIVRKRDKKECKRRKECGRHGDLVCSNKHEPVL